jgi:hypothetical protein
MLLGGFSVPVYAVKIFRLVAIYVSVALATRIHEAQYVETVYGKGLDPPRLNSINVNVALMLLFVNCFVWIALHIGRQAKQYVTDETYYYLVSETFFYTALTLIAGYLIANVVSHKKYFNYRRDGLRAIRAFRDLVMAVVVPVGLSPFYFGD